MAHSGPCCNSDCTCNLDMTSCGSHRAVCTANRTNYTDNDGTGYLLNSGTAIRAIHINELRSTIHDELVSRNNHSSMSYTTTVSGSNASEGDSITAAHIQNIDEAIDRIASGTSGETSVGDPIYAIDISNLRLRIRNLEDDCICNSDGEVWCSCHVDCNCNY